MKKLLALLLVAAPLGAAQQTVVVPDVNVENTNVIDGIQLDVTVTLPPPDSAAVARDEAAARAMAAIEEYLANCGCMNQGPSGVTQVATAGIVLALGLIWLELRKGNKDGMDGAPGAPGHDGADGADGQDGQDGVDAQDHKHDDDSESEH